MSIRDLIRVASGACAAGTLVMAISSAVAAQSDSDFGAMVEHLLEAQSTKLFGIVHPLDESALGPYTGTDANGASVLVAPSLTVSLVSSAVHTEADMIALWPDDEHPVALYVCVENGTGGPAVQRVDLAGNPASNVRTILQGMSSCDPIRRTPWGSLVAAEEAGAIGGLYEIMNPESILAPVMITNRATGATTDGRVVKRKAVGALSWEGNHILPDGTMYMGDELRPGLGKPGGAIYKFVPMFPFAARP